MSFSAAPRLLLRPPLLHPLRPRLHRGFRASPSRSTFLDATTTVLTTLHSSSGLPWAFIIPLSAFTLRLALVPLTLYTRTVTSKIITLSPLQEARTHQLAKAYAKTSDPREWEKHVRQHAATVRKEMWARWGCQRWKLYLPLLQLPVWVGMSATLRALLPGHHATDETSAEVVEKTADWIVTALGGLTPPAPAPQGLLSEGLPFALDLTLPDPTLTLPLLFFGALAGNHLLQSYTGPPPTTARQRVFRNSLGVLTMVMGLVAVQAPAALVLYWMSSAGFSLLLNAALHVYRPLPQRVERCKGGAIEEGKRLMNAEAVVLGGKVVG
ncbi:60Kd inner membrane protein-domain-containing protein [Tricharina praecox]|uniref:60Kd inner membrane protein-domain-containing protein n=1 Tax=Tricharina praecox TaxID=43433 RepID=UPI00221F8A7A|nr:60Kd inner membrane protein-domain-containing protein [Tricharina praecox]KAI5857266.1 60Kd inner membrane protein-domain-containing protein [Tricharina praecox]